MSRDLHVTSPMMRGADQTRLQALRYAVGNLDGAYGPTTVAPCGASSAIAISKADGVVGPRTQAELATATTQASAITPSAIAASALVEAQKHIGVSEHPAGSNRSPFGVWFGVDGVAWCNIIYAGKGCAYVPTTEAWLRASGLWIGRSEPIAGDIAIYNWNGGEADHIGIVVACLSGGVFEAIEGNTSEGNDSNGGVVMRRRRNFTQVDGFGRIA
jgi:hypothetical protein